MHSRDVAWPIGVLLRPRAPQKRGGCGGGGSCDSRRWQQQSCPEAATASHMIARGACIPWMCVGPDH